MHPARKGCKCGEEDFSRKGATAQRKTQRKQPKGLCVFSLRRCAFAWEMFYAGERDGRVAGGFTIGSGVSVDL
jgi:hypothetical protein